MSSTNNRLNLGNPPKKSRFSLEKIRSKYLKKAKNTSISRKNRHQASALDVSEPRPPKAAQYHTLEQLINAESALGRTIFGPIPAGHQREFFKYKDNIWIWHESWHERGKNKEITVRYDVKKDGVYKKLPGKSYRKISGDELKNFQKALRVYLNIVKKELY